MTADEIANRIQEIEQRLARLEAKRAAKKAAVTEDEQHAAERVIAALNKKAGKAFRAEGQAVQLVAARLRDGYAVEDLLKVVWHKWAEWRGSDMAKYLRPSTLFAAGKFTERVDEARDAWEQAQERARRTA